MSRVPSSPSAFPPTSPALKRRRIDGKAKAKATDGAGCLIRDLDADEQALPPVIVALDVDCFYAQASRIRDPTLNGLPVGVQQKTILAAVSYEARALGVPKIVSMREALRILPSLVIVNGEDLSYFRLLSNRNWRLLRSLVWGERVEKCGMDELWADVTATVDDHLTRCDINTVRRAEDGSIFFSFDQRPVDEIQPLDEARGFWYNTTQPVPGYFVPDPHSFEQGWPPDRWRQRYALGAHITSFFRRIILERVTLRCSGGVSFSKQMSKLCCSVNKPDKQTCFCPSQPLNEETATTSNFVKAFIEAAQAYIDPMDLGKLNGFGHVYVKKLEEIHQTRGADHGASAGGVEDTRSEFDWLYGHTDTAKAKNRLTVERARKAFSAQDFDLLFGTNIGPRLWDILHANDTEPVAVAADFAHQISIEDTYRNLKGEPVIVEMRKLSESLLKRLEVECVDMPDEVWLARTQRAVTETVLFSDDAEAGRVGSKDGPLCTQVRKYVDDGEDPVAELGRKVAVSASRERAFKNRLWRRYPLSVRLSLRIGWGARFSRTGRMPVGIFDLSRPRAERAEILLNTVVTNLFRPMTASRDIEEGFNLINIAALDLSKSPPATRDIKDLLFKASTSNHQSSDVKRPDEPHNAQGSSPARQAPLHDIDMGMLKELPPDIAQEIAEEYGIPWPLAGTDVQAPSSPASRGPAPFDSSSPTTAVAFETPSSSPPPPPPPESSATPIVPSSPTFVSFPPSQLSPRSFSPPSVAFRLGTPDGDEPAEDSALPQPIEQGPCLQSDAPTEQDGDGDTTRLAPPRARFGHFELSGLEMSAEELEGLLAPPESPSLLASVHAGETPRDVVLDAPASESDSEGRERVASESSSEKDEATELGPPVKETWEERACAHCGRLMQIWLQHDHDLFGERGLPPAFDVPAPAALSLERDTKM